MPAKIDENTIIFQRKDRAITFFWQEAGGIVQKSVDEIVINDIITALPRSGESTDQTLFQKITLFCGRTPTNNYNNLITLFSVMSQYEHSFTDADMKFITLYWTKNPAPFTEITNSESFINCLSLMLEGIDAKNANILIMQIIECVEQYFVNIKESKTQKPDLSLHVKSLVLLCYHTFYENNLFLQKNGQPIVNKANKNKQLNYPIL